VEDSRDRTGLPEPIELPGGVRLASLREAIVHLVNTIPSSERGIPVVLTAAELITSAAQRGGPNEFARIATLRAFNRHAVREFNPHRKDPHWGRRKLVRDEASTMEPGNFNDLFTMRAQSSLSAQRF
jgi:hypothetical protein